MTDQNTHYMKKPNSFYQFNSQINNKNNQPINNEDSNLNYEDMPYGNQDPNEIVITSPNFNKKVGYSQRSSSQCYDSNQPKQNEHFLNNTL